MFKFLKALWAYCFGGYPAKTLPADYKAPPIGEKHALPADYKEHKPRPSPGDPDWPGRVKLSYVVDGWAVPGHPLYFYQQALAYQANKVNTPEPWVIGWTEEGVSYLVPKDSWEETEILEAKMKVIIIRDKNNPYSKIDKKDREYWQSTFSLTPHPMSSQETDTRIKEYENYQTSVLAATAKIFDELSAATEKSARNALDSDADMQNKLRNDVSERYRRNHDGNEPEPAILEKLVAAEEHTFIQDIVRAAITKRKGDAAALLLSHSGTLSAVPLEVFKFDHKPPTIEEHPIMADSSFKQA